MEKDKKVIILATLIWQACFPACAQYIEEDPHFNAVFRMPAGGWIAGDGTYSVTLPDGRTLFLMGDSFIGEVNSDIEIAPGATMIRNCALVYEGDSLRTLFEGSYSEPDDFIATAFPDSTWYWPEHGLVEKDILKVFMAKYTTDPEGTPGWNFVFLGHDIAYFSLPEFKLLRIESLPYFELNGVLYGSSIWSDNSYAYVYGRKDDTLSGFSIPYPHLARTEDTLQGKWEFFDGEQWSYDTLATQRINDFQVSQQYSVFRHKNKYVMITQDIWLSSEIYSFTSETPYGPWVNKTLLYTTPILFDDSYTYNTFAHPQFDTNNSLLISYNTNGNFSDIFQNVEIYRPVFIRVPYGLIDQDFIDENPELIIDKNAAKLNIYPNPVKDRLRLYPSGDYINSRFISIYHITGKLEKVINLDSTIANDTGLSVDVSDLPSGLYVLIVHDQDGYVTSKFIKAQN